jgi:3-oxoacyl-[acyl-carrier-protein] synthase II
VSSTKPVTGHLLGAAGALETVVATLALKEGVVPTTLNFERGAPGCDLDYVAGGSRDAKGLRVALNLSCGFGGVNSCLVIARAG